MSAIDDVRDVRIKKLNILKSKGINPYPNEVSPHESIKDLRENFSSVIDSKKNITILGRILSKRRQGALSFVDLNDGTERFQVLFKKDVEIKYLNFEKENGFELFIETVDIGDFIEVSGEVFLTKTEEPTVLVSSWRMLSKSLQQIPDSWYGLKDEDEVFRKRYIDILLNKEVRESIERRSIFWNAFRTFLLERKFIEVETPVLETTTGGADARPFTSHHNALDIDVYLRISCGELWQKKLLVAGLPKVFEIGRIFRNEGMSHEHAQDYTQIEFYESYSDYKKGMEMVRNLYIYVAEKTFGKTSFEINGNAFDLNSKWETLDFVEIIKKAFGIDVLSCELSEIIEIIKKENIPAELKGINKERGVDVLWKVCRKKIVGPGFLINVPVFMEPLAKKSEKDERVVERFQVILGGSEMGKGFSELNDPLDQEERFKHQEALRESGDEEAQMKDDSFIEALEYGMPPAFGFGVSERLFSALSGKSVREAQIFPLMRPRN